MGIRWPKSARNNCRMRSPLLPSQKRLVSMAFVHGKHTGWTTHISCNDSSRRLSQSEAEDQEEQQTQDDQLEPILEPVAPLQGDHASRSDSLYDGIVVPLKSRVFHACKSAWVANHGVVVNLAAAKVSLEQAVETRRYPHVDVYWGDYSPPMINHNATIFLSTTASTRHAIGQAVCEAASSSRQAVAMLQGVLHVLAAIGCTSGPDQLLCDASTLLIEVRRASEKSAAGVVLSRVYAKQMCVELHRVVPLRGNGSGDSLDTLTEPLPRGRAASGVLDILVQLGAGADKGDRRLAGIGTGSGVQSFQCLWAGRPIPSISGCRRRWANTRASLLHLLGTGRPPAEAEQILGSVLRTLGAVLHLGNAGLQVDSEAVSDGDLGGCRGSSRARGPLQAAASCLGVRPSELEGAVLAQSGQIDFYKLDRVIRAVYLRLHDFLVSECNRALAAAVGGAARSKGSSVAEDSASQSESMSQLFVATAGYVLRNPRPSSINRNAAGELERRLSLRRRLELVALRACVKRGVQDGHVQGQFAPTGGESFARITSRIQAIELSLKVEPSMRWQHPEAPQADSTTIDEHVTDRCWTKPARGEEHPVVGFGTVGDYDTLQLGASFISIISSAEGSREAHGGANKAEAEQVLSQVAGVDHVRTHYVIAPRRDSKSALASSADGGLSSDCFDWGFVDAQLQDLLVYDQEIDFVQTLGRTASLSHLVSRFRCFSAGSSEAAKRDASLTDCAETVKELLATARRCWFALRGTSCECPIPEAVVRAQTSTDSIPSLCDDSSRTVAFVHLGQVRVPCSVLLPVVVLRHDVQAIAAARIAAFLAAATARLVRSRKQKAAIGMQRAIRGHITRRLLGALWELAVGEWLCKQLLCEMQQGHLIAAAALHQCRAGLVECKSVVSIVANASKALDSPGLGRRFHSRAIDLQSECDGALQRLARVSSSCSDLVDSLHASDKQAQALQSAVQSLQHRIQANCDRMLKLRLTNGSMGVLEHLRRQIRHTDALHPLLQRLLHGKRLETTARTSIACVGGSAQRVLREYDDAVASVDACRLDYASLRACIYAAERQRQKQGMQIMAREDASARLIEASAKAAAERAMYQIQAHQAREQRQMSSEDALSFQREHDERQSAVLQSLRQRVVEQLARDDDKMSSQLVCEMQAAQNEAQSRISVPDADIAPAAAAPTHQADEPVTVTAGTPETPSGASTVVSQPDLSELRQLTSSLDSVLEGAARLDARLQSRRLQLLEGQVRGAHTTEEDVDDESGDLAASARAVFSSGPNRSPDCEPAPPGRPSTGLALGLKAVDDAAASVRLYASTMHPSSRGSMSPIRSKQGVHPMPWESFSTSPGEPESNSLSASSRAQAVAAVGRLHESRSSRAIESRSRDMQLLLAAGTAPPSNPSQSPTDVAALPSPYAAAARAQSPRARQGSSSGFRGTRARSPSPPPMQRGSSRRRRSPSPSGRQGGQPSQSRSGSPLAVAWQRGGAASAGSPIRKSDRDTDNSRTGKAQSSRRSLGAIRKHSVLLSDGFKAAMARGAGAGAVPVGGYGDQDDSIYSAGPQEPRTPRPASPCTAPLPPPGTPPQA